MSARRGLKIAAMSVAALIAITGIGVVAWALAIHRGWIPPQIAYRSELQIASRFIEEVEEFRRVNGRLPDRHEVKPPSGSKPPLSMRYELSAVKNEYMIDLSVGIDDRFVYQSATRRWSFEEPDPS